MSNFAKRLLALLLAAVLTLSLAACAPKQAADAPAADSNAAVVNIGATGSLGSLNPLLIDATWINYYAISMSFRPLVALNANAEFENILADSITTEDSIHYTIRLKDEANWSDGTPITADDVAWTMRHLASPIIANPNMMLSAMVGTDDDTGYLPEGVDEFEGVRVVDEKTVEFTFKYEMNLISFLNGYAQYIFPLPSAALRDIPEAELATTTYFNAPTVVSGPYIPTSVDTNHYITYKANENYWAGAPKIALANIRIVDPAELLPALQTGEIDIVMPLLAAIPETDYASVKELENVNAAYGAAYAVESLFLNTEVVSDARVRRAMRLAIDRQAIIDGLLGGAGERYDGFAVPDGPYATGIAPADYDVDAAKALMEEAIADGWDASRELNLYINSGEATLVNAAALVQNYWAEIGVKCKITTVDLDTLMTVAGTEDCAVHGVQYTYAVVDPSWDIQWVLDDWCHYMPDAVADALNALWTSNDTAFIAQQYAAIDACVEADAPVIDLYVNGPLGAVAKRLSGAEASMYGALNNIQEWTISQ